MRSKILSKQVDELIELSKKYKTMVLINIRKVPAQLQKNIRARIEGYSKVLKKTVVNRLIKARKGNYQIDYPVLLIFTNLTPYNVEKLLRQEQLSVAAKAGQIATDDIIVEEMDTTLAPGPSLSVLKQAGLDAKVDKGKIKIAKTTTLVKAGQTITSIQAQALQLLGIKPFKIRAKIAYAYDWETEFPSNVFEFDQNLAKDIEDSTIQVVNLAINTSYPNSLSIEKILINALNQAINLSTNTGYYSSMSIESIIYKNVFIGYYIKGDKI